MSSGGFRTSFSDVDRRGTIARMGNFAKKNTIRRNEEDYFLDTIRAKGFAKVSLLHTSLLHCCIFSLMTDILFDDVQDRKVDALRKMRAMPVEVLT